MLKTYLYIPDSLEEKIDWAVRALRQSKAEVMRRAIEEGIRVVQTQGNASAGTLLKLAELGQKSKFSGPKDSSKKIDELLWGKDWSRSDK